MGVGVEPALPEAIGMGLDGRELGMISSPTTIGPAGEPGGVQIGVEAALMISASVRSNAAVVSAAAGTGVGCCCWMT